MNVTPEQIAKMTPEQIAALFNQVSSPRSRKRQISVNSKGGIYIFDPEAKAISSKGKPYSVGINVASPEAAKVLFSEDVASEVVSFCEELIANPGLYRKLEREAIEKKESREDSGVSGSRHALV